MKTSRLLSAGLLTLVLVMTNCGGGNSSTPAPPQVIITVTPAVLPYGIVNQPYPGAQLQANGGTAPYTFTSANLPAGLTLSTDGKLAGTTPNSGPMTFPILVTAHDSAGNTGISALNLDTHWPLGVAVSNPEVSSGVQYQGYIVISMQENNLTATAKITGGSLPPGLTLGAATPQGPNPSVAITGTPTQSGIFTFTTQATDSLTPPRTVQADLKMYIDVKMLRFVTSWLSTGKRGDAFLESIPLIGGTPPYTCTLAPGSDPLPPGLSVGAGCQVSGTPTQIGMFSFTLRATDSGSGNQLQTTDQAFTMQVLEPVKVADNLLDATTGESYTASISISGGTPPYYIYGLSTDLCCFVIEKHDFTIHGVPHVAGPHSMLILVGDSAGQSINANVTLNVQEGPFRIGSGDFPRAKAGFSYGAFLTAVSGKQPLTWNVTSGALPPGIGITNYTDGAWLTGTPTTAGSNPFTLEVADSSSPPQKLTIPVDITVYSKLPRNDTIPTADFLFDMNSYLYGSFSPYADPVDIANPDTDYYHFRAFAGETVEVGANYSGIGDPVIEIVDANGQQFNTCRNPGDDVPDAKGNVDATPLAFDDVCMNDDMVPGNISSELMFRVPGASGTLVDLYVHVLDFTGNARPEMGSILYFRRYIGPGVID